MTLIRDVLAMDFEHFATLTYTNDKGDTVVIPPWQQALLKILKRYSWWQSKTSFGPVDDWTQVTKDNFDDFRLGPDCQSSFWSKISSFYAASTSCTPNFGVNTLQV
jgi:hypothetical protein